jgi:ABC-type amino acid transport substrate-binding protein
MMKRINSIVFLVLMAALVSACAHGPGQSGNSTPNLVLSRILARGKLIVGTTGRQPPLNETDKEGKVI